MKAKLLANVGATTPKLLSKVTFVPINHEAHRDLLHHGNTILFFPAEPERGIASAFEEVCLMKLPKRGTLWQQHEDATAQVLRRVLMAELAARSHR